MSEGYVYTYGDILASPYKFKRVTKLKITREINQHAKLVIAGIINDEASDKYVENADDEAGIKVSVKNDKGRITDMFYGIVSNISINADNDVRTLKIEALSNTALMDIDKKSRSFQDKSYSYKDIIDIVNKGSKNAQVLDNATKGAKINGLVVQYNETDWELVKRLTSHFNAGVIPECQLSDIKYSLGKSSECEACDINEFNYTVRKGLQEYKLKVKNEDMDIVDMDLVSYEVTTNKIINLSSKVSFKGRSLYVYKSETEMTEGRLLSTYILRDEKGIKVRKINNNKIIGVSLKGSILDTSKDVVKVNLEIDGNQDKETAKWFPYSTVYSSKDGTGWYCMPEAGDAVRLYFPDSEEKNAYVISSVNLSSDNSEKRSDPSVKSIGTKYGKEVVMKPKAVEIIGGTGMLMRMTDDGGIEVNSDKKIILAAKDDIEINGGAKVTIQGNEGVNLTQAKANMKIQDNVVMSGGKVKIQ